MAIIPTFGRLRPWNKDVSSKTRYLICLSYVILHSRSPSSRPWGHTVTLLKCRLDSDNSSCRNPESGSQNL